MAEDIERKPTKKVTGVTITRDGGAFVAKWKVPSGATSTSNDDRFSNIEIEWTRVHPKGNAKKEPKWTVNWFIDTSETESRVTLGLWKGTAKHDEKKPLKRESYYPCTGAKLARIDVCLWGHNGYGNGPGSWYMYKFAIPRAPQVSWEYDQESARAIVTVKTDEGKDNRERYDTMVKVAIRQQNGKEKVIYGWDDVRSTEWKYAVDVSPYITNLQQGKYVTVKCWAYARGFMGNNPEPNKAVYAERNIAMPAAGKINGKITVDRKTQTGRIKVPVKLGAWTTGVQLQRRHGPDGSWEDVSGAHDNGNCKALYDSYGAAAPVDGERIWYRLKSTRDNFEVYSAAVRADKLFTAKDTPKCTSDVAIIEVRPGPVSAGVDVGFIDATSNSGTELLYSTHPAANFTNDPAERFEVDGTPTAKKKYGGKTYSYRSLALYDLTQETTYYLWARRYKYVGDDKIYSAYSDRFEFRTSGGFGDKTTITKVSPSKDGTSAKITVEWNDKGVLKNGVELSWSESSGAWSSDVEEPSRHNFTTSGKSGKATYEITGLTPGKTYYVHSRRWYVEGGTDLYSSKYDKRQKFTTESAEDDTCAIGSIQLNSSGKGVVVVVGYKEDNANTGTELAWSTHSDAMKSNEQPSTMQATWAADKTSQVAGWPKSQTINLYGLEKDTTYYMWARRYLDAGGTTTYGAWSKMGSFISRSDAVQAGSCGIVSAVPNGKSAEIVVGWTETVANTGTEISWSTDKDAWESNAQPSTLQATWEDREPASASWKKTQKVYLRNLDPGSTYYVKARRYSQEDGTFGSYSDVVTVSVPSDSSSSDVRCGLVSCEPGEDGRSAKVTVGWAGDHTGCELSWSDNPNAWEANEKPKTFEFEWIDETSASETWAKTSTAYIYGLTEGTTYYVRARSYYGKDKVWSAYTEGMSVTPYSAPTNVILQGPSAIARGQAIELYWTVESEQEQTEWHVHEDGSPNVSLADGEGTLARASITPERYGDRDSISFYVEAGCGGGLTASNVVSVGIADVPSCDVYAPTTLTEQPATFEAYTDTPGAMILCTCRSLGITQARPDGDRDQMPGYAVWTDSLTPEWTQTTWGSTGLRASLQQAVADATTAHDAAEATLAGMTEGDEGYEDAVVAEANAATALADAQAALSEHPSDGSVYMAQVEMADDSTFVDGGTYSVGVRAVESVARLSSPEAQSEFMVAWAHQANAPDGISVVPNVADRSVTINLHAPAGSTQGDVFDIYRATPTGHVLVARDLDLDATVTDAYAPFGRGKLHYRACLRTPDGDIEFDDFYYELPCGMLRFDWDGKHVELPFNLVMSESYEKGFEARGHADGEEQGYFDRSVLMTGSFSTDLVKLRDQEQINLVRQLGEYAGAVFCRTNTGMAFQCNAQVSELSIPYDTAAVAVQISVTGISTTDEFRIGA